MVNYSRITPEDGMVMKKASGDDSTLQHGFGKSFRSPDLGTRLTVAADVFLEILLCLSGFCLGMNK